MNFPIDGVSKSPQDMLQAKWAITLTVFIVVGHDNFVQSRKPARKNLMQHAHTKPKTKKSKKEYIWEIQDTRIAIKYGMAGFSLY